MSRKKLWLLRLVPEGRLGKLLMSLALFVSLSVFFSFVSDEVGDNPTPTLFFSLIVAYIVPIFGHIAERAREAFAELRPLLPLTDEEFASEFAKLDGFTRRDRVIQLAGGSIAGLTHANLIFGPNPGLFLDTVRTVPGAVSALGTVTIWVLMTTVVYTLIQQGAVFARAGRHVRLDLDTWRNLVPFARIALISSLAILGALSMFPLIGLEGGMDWVEILPGAVATAIPMVVIFLLPVWPLHRRMLKARFDELHSVDCEIGRALRGQTFLELPAGEQSQLTHLMHYRREVSDLPSWPFDVRNVTRLLFYLVIPPLTWVAAALMENVVDAVLS